MFNHLMLMFAQKPHLMGSFWSFVLGFGTSREVRSLDAEIKLFKLQTMLPEIIPKKYEKMDLEFVSYHGAYVRTMTLMIVEGIIKSHLSAVKQGANSHEVEATANCLETLLRELMISNFNNKIMSRAEQPYSEGHRMRVRTWQFLLVMLQLLDPEVYTPAYREYRTEKVGYDIVKEIQENLWNVISLNHVPTIRQYLEIFTIKFILKFPDDTITDTLFYKTLLDPKQPKAHVSSSMLMIVGFVLNSELNTEHAIAFKKKIFESFLGYATSNSAHSRCIVHYFLIKLQQDSQYGAAFMPSGVKPIIDYLAQSKDAKRMFQKYSEDLDVFAEVANSQEGVDIILSTKLD